MREGRRLLQGVLTLASRTRPAARPGRPSPRTTSRISSRWRGHPQATRRSTHPGAYRPA